MPRTVKVDGWALVKGKRWRTLEITDCLGSMARQVCMWSNKSTAKQMALPGERPVKVRALYFEREGSDGG